MQAKLSKLIEQTDLIIAELVVPKVEMQKMYNYYNGIRDKEQFKYLEENYGIGSPISVEFTPLIRKHIDALVGEFLETPILPKVSCKDESTISNISREKLLYIESEVYKYLLNKLKSAILNIFGDKYQLDGNIEDLLNKLIEDLDEGFISKYETAAQDVLEYIILSRDVDLINKLKSLLLDILITGYCFYRVKKSPSETNIRIEVLDPLNVFIDRNFNSPYVKHSHRAVVRRWLSKHQVLAEYGDLLTKEDIKTISDEWDRYFDNYNSYLWIALNKAEGTPATDGLLAGLEVTPGCPTDYRKMYNNRLIPVYEVEWIETDKDFTMQRYKTVRIGAEIYILTGKDEGVIRTLSNPRECTLSVNGVYFLNRSIEPFSLVKTCMTLQDRYDVLIFYRDRLIASSGSVGDWIDLSLIPSLLGVNLPDRLQKWQAYKKLGTALIDTSQEGRLAAGQAPINTIFNGYDDTIKAQAVLAILFTIDSLEATMSSITGVFRERLNGIEARDAVSNVKVGLRNSFTITKLYYHQMDLVTNEILLDTLNQAKIVYKNGLTGTIILGDKMQKIFTALPEYFTLTDYDVHITTSSTIMLEMLLILMLIPELIKSGQAPIDIIIEAATAKSISELRYLIKKAVKKLKEENNLLQKIAEQAQQLQQQLQQTLKELEKAQKELKKYDLQQFELDKQKLQMQNKLEWFKAQTDRTYKLQNIKVDEKKVEAEIYLMHDGNPYNDKINFD